VTLPEELTAMTYRPGPYASFHIHEPKKRLISAAPFRDRVVHHALCNVIEPAFEASFIADSYANRVGKGTHRALNRCQAFARRYRYVLPCDVRQFFRNGARLAIVIPSLLSGQVLSGLTPNLSRRRASSEESVRGAQTGPCVATDSLRLGSELALNAVKGHASLVSCRNAN
jgi:hypothetical protein